MKTALGTSLAATALALAISTTAFAQNKGVSESKGGPHKGGAGYEEDVRTVPEPSTLALLGAGIAGIVFLARRRKK